MAPPSYADLGKNARDLFSKGYNFGFIKIDSTTKAHDNAEFKMAASHNIAASKMSGNLDLKYKVPKYGLTLTEKWNTDSVFGTELCLTDQGCKGTKITLDSTYSPVSAKHSSKVKGEFGQDKLKVTSDVTLDASGSPHVNAAFVVGHEGFLFGYNGGYSTQQDLKATFSAQVNMANFNEGGHKFGVGFEYDPCC